MSLINRAAVKKRVLEYAKQTRAHTWTQVSKSSLDRVERATEAAIRAVVNAAPSKGKTL
jgi:hypothetical protein